MTIAWYDPTNHHVSTNKDDPLFTPLGQVWPLGRIDEAVEDDLNNVLWKANYRYDLNKMPTKLFGPNLVEILNAAGFYKKKEWVGLADDEMKQCSYDAEGFMVEREVAMRTVEAKLKEKNT